ncbi:TonB-dependent receptor domain-containing protein [Sphingomonas metalli]|nr:TonB-dependent receptor [Sphingomonas metalli]
MSALAGADAAAKTRGKPAPAPASAEPVPASAEKAGDDASGENITVTGSRLSGYDPTSDVRVYTADDIKALGVSSIQDFIRTLPQNQASVGYGINNRERTEVKFDAGGLGGLGVAGVNLRGLGTRNTLVLVNGRRIAGAAGIEDGFANINTIPLAAVDRVEINLSGSGAIYGADALGGVVNFILKKGYKGLSFTVRHEFSSTGADITQSTGTAATSWGTGSITATLSATKTDPARNAKLGYVTRDYSSYFTPDDLAALGRTYFPLDQRSALDGAQPAALLLSYSALSNGKRRNVTQVLQYRGRPGSTPQFADLGPVDRATIGSVIPPDAGEYHRDIGMSVNLEQKVTDRLHLTLDYLGSRGRSLLRESWDYLLLSKVPFEQAYSPIRRSDLPASADFGAIAGYSAYYFPRAEYDSGSQTPGFQRSRIVSDSVTLGAAYEFSHDTVLRANYTASNNRASGVQRGLVNVVERSRTDGSCRANQNYVGKVRDLDRVAASQCAALTSSDPNLAFNFLNDGSSTRGAPLSVFFLDQYQLANTARLRNADLLLTSAPLTLPAGKLRLAIGGETYSNGVTGERIRQVTAEAVNTRMYAGYVEARVPVIGKAMGVPLIWSFDLSLKARYDRYDTRGPVGTVDNIPYEEGGRLIRGKSSFSRVSPDLAAAWSPFHGLLIQGSWASTFSPPPFTNLYNVKGGQVSPEFLFLDPLAPDGNIFQFRDIDAEYRGNPKLRPSVSSSYHLGATLTPPRFLQNLSVQVDYYNTRIRDQIGLSTDLENLLKPEVYYGLKDYFIRDTGGNIVKHVLTSINIGWARSESIDVNASYAIPTAFAVITPAIVYSRNLRQETSYDGSNVISMLGTAQGLDRYKLIGSLNLASANWSARFTARYTPGYDNNYNLLYDDGQISDADGDGVIDKPFPVHSLTTYDLAVRWRAMPKLTLSCGGRNIFHAKPPFALIDRRPFDASRYDLRGRVLYLEARADF